VIAAVATPLSSALLGGLCAALVILFVVHRVVGLLTPREFRSTCAVWLTVILVVTALLTSAAWLIDHCPGGPPMALAAVGVLTLVGVMVTVRVRHPAAP
jgi:uncharacterized membrane protein